MKIENCIKDFLLESEIKKFTPKTIKGYRTNLNRFVHFCKEDEITDMDDVDFVVVKRFSYWLINKGYKPTYTNSLLKTLKCFIQFCYEEGYGGFDTNKRKFIWAKETLPVILPFQPKDVKKLLQNCSGNTFLDIRDYAIMTIFIETGIRAWECCCIKNEDVFEDYIIIKAPKNRKQRLVGITPVLRKAMNRYDRVKESYFDKGKKIDDYYFLSVNGKQLSNSAMQHMFRRRGEGIDADKCRISPHSLRHFFAVQSLKQGRDIYSISTQLGHSSLKQTSEYLRTLSQEDVVKMAQTSSVLMNMRD